jgi:hypothetical protein
MALLLFAFLFSPTAQAVQNLAACESGLVSHYRLNDDLFLGIRPDQILIRGTLRWVPQSGTGGWAIAEKRLTFMLGLGDEVFVLDKYDQVVKRGRYGDIPLMQSLAEGLPAAGIQTITQEEKERLREILRSF